MDYDSYIECCEIFLKKLTEIINNKNIKIYFIEHKKLLSEYKATIKNLINWLGFDFNNKLLKSSENVEIVTTASKNQLKKNINKQNSKNWNDIKKQLPESFMTKIQELNNNFNKLINHKK
jgi:ribosomal protein L7Ae-like RNA K-turn-binding protein